MRCDCDLEQKSRKNWNLSATIVIKTTERNAKKILASSDKRLTKPIRPFTTHSENKSRGLEQTALGQHSLTIMTSLHGSSLERMEDRSSIVSKLKDVEKVLKEIEGNTHKDRGNRSVFRRKIHEKVGLEMRSLACEQAPSEGGKKIRRSKA